MCTAEGNRIFSLRGQQWSKVSKFFGFKKCIRPIELISGMCRTQRCVGGGGSLFFSRVKNGGNWPNLAGRISSSGGALRGGGGASPPTHTHCIHPWARRWWSMKIKGVLCLSAGPSPPRWPTERPGRLPTPATHSRTAPIKAIASAASVCVTAAGRAPVAPSATRGCTTVFWTVLYRCAIVAAPAPTPPPLWSFQLRHLRQPLYPSPPSTPPLTRLPPTVGRGVGGWGEVCKFWQFHFLVYPSCVPVGASLAMCNCMTVHS